MINIFFCILCMLQAFVTAIQCFHGEIRNLANDRYLACDLRK